MISSTVPAMHSKACGVLILITLAPIARSSSSIDCWPLLAISVHLLVASTFLRLIGSPCFSNRFGCASLFRCDWRAALLRLCFSVLCSWCLSASGSFPISLWTTFKPFFFRCFWYHMSLTISKYYSSVFLEEVYKIQGVIKIIVLYCPLYSVVNSTVRMLCAFFGWNLH